MRAHAMCMDIIIETETKKNNDKSSRDTTLPFDTRLSSDNLSYTIGYTHLGAPVQYAASGIKIPSLQCQPQSVGDKLFSVHCCNT